MKRTVTVCVALLILYAGSVAQDKDTPREGEPIVQTAVPYTDDLFKGVKFAHIYPGERPLLVTHDRAGYQDMVSKLHYLEGGKAHAVINKDGEPVVGNSFTKLAGAHGGIAGEVPDAFWYKDEYVKKPMFLFVKDGIATISEQRFREQDRVVSRAGRLWVLAQRMKSTTEGNVTKTDKWVELWYTDGTELKQAADAEGNFIDFSDRIDAAIGPDGDTLITSYKDWRMKDGVFSRIPYLAPPDKWGIREFETQRKVTPEGIFYYGMNTAKTESRVWRNVDGAAVWVMDAEGQPISHTYVGVSWVDETLWLVGRDKLDEQTSLSAIYSLKAGVAQALELPESPPSTISFDSRGERSVLSARSDAGTSYWVIKEDKLAPVMLPDGKQLVATQTKYTNSFTGSGAQVQLYVPGEGRYLINGDAAVPIASGENRPFDSAVPPILSWKDWEIISWQDPEKILDTRFGVVTADGEVSPLRREKKGKLWEMSSAPCTAAVGSDGVYFCTSLRGTDGPFMLYYLGE